MAKLVLEKIISFFLILAISIAVHASELSEKKKKANNGDVSALFEVGVHYYMEENFLEALHWLERSANKGHSVGQTITGTIYEWGYGAIEEDYNKAISWYRKAANQNTPQAQTRLATMYFEGRGTQVNEEKAIYWYKKAAENGESEAQYALGLIYFKGHGSVKKDYNKFYELIKSSALQGNEKAIDIIVTLAKNGDSRAISFIKEVSGN